MTWRRPQSAPSNSAAFTTATKLPRRQQIDQGIGAALAGRAWWPSLATRHAARRPDPFLSWPASPKSKWISKPASTHRGFPGVADVGTVIHPRAWAARCWAARRWASARDRPEVGLRPALRPALAKRFHTTSRRRFWMRRSTCSGPRSIFRIRKLRSARAASASRRSARLHAILNALSDALGDESSAARR
jgi:hypothetical protein